MNQSPDMQELDALTLPLQGWRLIEASAGTGKTWTLAALYVRLVLGHQPGCDQPGLGLMPPQILVMTFTDAATAELRERIRARLAQAAVFFRASVAQADDFLAQLRAALAPASWPVCAQRLEQAAQWMDEAAIHTIHSWCSRMLRTHAFESASLFTQNRITDAAQRQLAAVQDYWRRWYYPLAPDALMALDGVATTPQALLQQLQDLWRAQERQPEPAASDLPAPDALLARWLEWQRQRQVLEPPARVAWTAAVVQLVQDAAASKVLKNYRSNWLPGWLNEMADWAQGQDIRVETLHRFSRRALLEAGWDSAGQMAVFEVIERLIDHLAQQPQVAQGLLAHAAQEVRQDYQHGKQLAGEFDFSDLLQNLYHALHAPDGDLARTIARQYPVALVDEFQDTDPWQFGSLRAIYGRGAHSATGYATDHTGEQTGEHKGALVMIGDPKQAIYGFRGADLHSYLQARALADGIYTLTVNYRSSAELVAAVNRVFELAPQPFGALPFVAAQPCPEAPAPLQVNGQIQAAMTVWHQPYPKVPTAEVFRHDMAAIFATRMVRLLASGAARAADMAVLVRNRFEAAAVRDALLRRGVRSVYLSERDSVFGSAQALDLWRVLRALAAPGDTRLLRSALLTRLWGLDWPALQTLLHDETAWDTLVEHCQQWQTVWRTQGVLPMLYRLLHDQGISQRLLAQGASGERALTNVLHLGELLQTASTALQGEAALVRYLHTQVCNPKASAETAPLRLESDADLVQVITLHKSKGLQYPLVFLPFLSAFTPEKDGPAARRSDAERLAEDIRLTYVALTRAQRALWLGVAQVAGDVQGKTPQVRGALSALLGRRGPDDLVSCLQRWASPHLVVAQADSPDDAVWTPTAPAFVTQTALLPRRLLQRRWWSASFSALTRDLGHSSGIDDDRFSDAQLDSSAPLSDASEQSDDAPGAAEPAFHALPAGARFGTLLHDLLQWQAEHNWPAHTAPLASAASASATEGLAADWAALVQRASQRAGLDPSHSDLLSSLVTRVVSTSWPASAQPPQLHALTLGTLGPGAYWPEMAFTLPVQLLSSVELDRQIGAQLWPGQPRPPLLARTLQGWVTGFIDLVFQVDGRYGVLDYKSNRLPGYAPAQLQAAMCQHRYDVQAVLYLLALHRLLKSRLPGYDPALHLGGVCYWFVRGVDQDGAGLLTLPPPLDLLQALDAALSHTPQEIA